MLFNSYTFLLVFLPLVLYLWWHRRCRVATRLAILTSASYFFYGWWDFRFVGLLMLSTLVDYTAGNCLAKAQTVWGRRAALLASLTTNLGLLAIFKYSGFFAESINAVVSAVGGAVGGGLGGAAPFSVWEFVLPVGISFYTFQTMSYTIDIYRNVAKPADSLLHFAAYVSMFPQLVAGPIVRYGDLEDQLRSVRQTPDWSLMARGCFFFVMGLSQKLLLADVLASSVDAMLQDYSTLKFAGSWFAMIGYTLQLYFDFAGYSNMAVGLGYLLGFQFPQNFNSPYKAKNISQFWRRWHMTLSGWLRDYLFVPLGGSERGRWLTLRNLVIVMFLGGLWHGAGWTFIIWGLFHGMLLVGHRLFNQRFPRRMPSILAVSLTFVGVILGWVLFRSTDLPMACSLFAAMAGGKGIESDLLHACGGVRSLGTTAVMLVVVFATPNVWQIRFRPTRTWMIVLAGLMFVCVLRIDRHSPFLYFQF